MTKKTISRASLVLGALLAAGLLQGCAPLIVGGAAVGSALMVTDRRTELKAGGKIREAIGDRGHVNVTSYNRLALITGEVPSEADRAAVEQAIQRIEGVKSTVNELAVAGNSSLTSRSNDVILTSKVKATFVDAKDLQANAFKVVTERGNVYLMGIVTEREANRAADLTAGISGVQKVVKVFEIVSEAELAGLQKTAAPSTPAKQ
jgi:osmotically-inducible protein OsmY